MVTHRTQEASGGCQTGLDRLRRLSALMDAQDGYKGRPEYSRPEARDWAARCTKG